MAAVDVRICGAGIAGIPAAYHRSIAAHVLGEGPLCGIAMPGLGMWSGWPAGARHGSCDGVDRTRPAEKVEGRPGDADRHEEQGQPGEEDSEAEGERAVAKDHRMRPRRHRDRP
ncbi:MAG: hypothetical protein C4312_02420 [Thermoflexus sp.]